LTGAFIKGAGTGLIGNGLTAAGATGADAAGRGLESGAAGATVIGNGFGLAGGTGAGLATAGCTVAGCSGTVCAGADCMAGELADPFTAQPADGARNERNRQAGNNLVAIIVLKISMPDFSILECSVCAASHLVQHTLKRSATLNIIFCREGRVSPGKEMSTFPAKLSVPLRIINGYNEP
jgi:hypothetical protein